MESKMFQKPLSYKGRIRRMEHGLSIILWYLFILCFVFISQIISEITNHLDLGYIILSPLIIISYWFLLCQSIKRSHDLGNSGWYILIPFYGFLLLFSNGEYGENKYGPNPKGIGNKDEIDDIGKETII